MNCIRSVFLILAALMLAIEFPRSQVCAASRLTDDFTELLRLADAVAEVNVSHIEAAPRGAARVPVMAASLKITKVHKGKLEPGSIVRVEYFGGFDGQHQLIAPGQPTFAVGDQALVLLMKHGGNWRFVGGDAGHVVLCRDQHGRQIARRAAGNFEYFMADSQALSGYAAIKSPSITAQRLEELVVAVLASGRPVLEGASELKTRALTPGPSPKQGEGRMAVPDSRVGLIFLGIGMMGGIWLAWRRYK